MRDGSALRFVRIDAVDGLLDVVRQGVAPRHFDEHRRAQEGPGELADLVRERGREHQALALRCQQVDDALDVGQEPHVQHAVGFVEHEQLHLGKIHRLLLDVVEQPARGRDEDLDALAKGRRLRLHVHAAEYDCTAQRRVPGVGLDVLVDLVGELARRRDDQGPHRMTRRRRAAARHRQQSVDDRQREARRLAGSGLGGAHDVAAGHHYRNRLGLDRGRLAVAEFGHGTQDRRVEPEITEFRCFSVYFIGLRDAGRLVYRVVLGGGGADSACDARGRLAY